MTYPIVLNTFNWILDSEKSDLKFKCLQNSPKSRKLSNYFVIKSLMKCLIFIGKDWKLFKTRFLKNSYTVTEKLKKNVYTVFFL